MFTASFSGINEAGRANSTSWTILHHDAALTHAGGLAAQLDRHADLDDLVLRNPREIDVDDVLPPRVPLQFADKGRLADGAGQANQPAPVPNGRRQVRRPLRLSDTFSKPCPYKIPGIFPDRRSRRFPCLP